MNMKVIKKLIEKILKRKPKVFYYKDNSVELDFPKEGYPFGTVKINGKKVNDIHRIDIKIEAGDVPTMIIKRNLHEEIK